MPSSPSVKPEESLKDAPGRGAGDGGEGLFSGLQVVSLLMLIAVLGLGLFLVKHRSRLSAEPILTEGDPGQYAFLINVNEAPWEELALLPGIGRQKAEAIVAHREANGPFEDIVDLQDVAGIGPKLSESIAPLIVFGEE